MKNRKSRKSTYQIISKGIVLSFILLMLMLTSCMEKELEIIVYETAANGNKLKQINSFTEAVDAIEIKLLPNDKFQTISGFGGAFTEASAHLLNQMSPMTRTEILEAYFSRKGANYSLTRTHMNSCDFSLSNYSYTPVEGDKSLEHFSIDEDRQDLIPMIKGALETSEDGFRLFASPWTAAPWMKDNNQWVGR